MDPTKRRARQDSLAAKGEKPFVHFFRTEAQRFDNELFTWDAFQGISLYDALYRWLTKGDANGLKELAEEFGHPPTLREYLAEARGGAVLTQMVDGALVLEEEEATTVIAYSKEHAALAYCNYLVARTDDKLDDLMKAIGDGDTIAQEPNLDVQV